MNIISSFYHYIYDAEYAALEQDESYRAAKNTRNELERSFVMSLTRKQRILFHQYQEKQEALADMELCSLFSRCSIFLTPKGK